MEIGAPRDGNADFLSTHTYGPCARSATGSRPPIWGILGVKIRLDMPWRGGLLPGRPGIVKTLSGLSRAASLVNGFRAGLLAARGGDHGGSIVVAGYWKCLIFLGSLRYI